MAPNANTFKIDYELLDKLLKAGCNGVQCAARFGIHEDSLYRKVEKDKGVAFSVYKREKLEDGNSELLLAQHTNATNGNTSMQVWLGKQRLGQRENPDDAGGFDGKLAQFLDMYKSFERLSTNKEKNDDN